MLHSQPSGLDRALRITTPKDFGLLKQSRHVCRGQSVVYVRTPNNMTHPRMGVIVTRKTGSAVVRNRWKRVIRAFFRTQMSSFEKGEDHLWVVKSSTKGKPRPTLLPELMALKTKSAKRFGKLNLDRLT